MKQTIVFILLIFFTGSMSVIDYSKTDKRAESVPQNLKTAGDIARYLTKGLTSPTDKARVIYYWIAHAIRYDVAKMNSNDTYKDPRELVNQVLKTRKGVCAHYATLFQACCQSVGVQSYIIEGYTRQNDKTIFIAHAWNAVKIDSRFYTIDATWAAGFLNGKTYIQKFRDNFFLIDPAEFIKTHMPFDPIWQFLNNPVNPKEFETNDFSGLDKASGFNFSDSIKALSGLSTLDKLIGENVRITTSGPTNALIRNHVRFNQQGITTEKYNKAADTFNKAVEKFNRYIVSKNKQFNNLTMTDDEILELLSSTRQLTESAGQTLPIVSSDNNDLNRLIDGLRKSINGMRKKLDTEDAFMSDYIKTLKTSRLRLFYKEI